MTKASKQSNSPAKVRKRKHEEDTLESPKQLKSEGSPAILKRARLNTSLTTPTSVQAPKETLDAHGQKTVLLGMIRQRLSELDNRTLYVTKLPRHTTLEQLKSLCPTSINARIQSKKFANRRKHAFIEFKSPDAAKSAIAAVNGKLIADRPIRAMLCSERLSTSNDATGSKKPHWVPPHQRQLNEFSLSALHVTCFPRTATQDEVRQLFQKADNFEFNMNPKQKSIGSCRITFSTPEDALESFKTMHNSLIRDCPLVVNFAFKKHKKRDTKSKANDSQSSIREPSSKRQKLDNKKTPVSEPPIVPTHCTPLGSKEAKPKKKKKAKRVLATNSPNKQMKLKHSPKSKKSASRK